MRNPLRIVFVLIVLGVMAVMTAVFVNMWKETRQEMKEKEKKFDEIRDNFDSKVATMMPTMSVEVTPTEAVAMPTMIPGGKIVLQYEGTYLGVFDYGEPETKKENVDTFRYKFRVSGVESLFRIDNSKTDEDGNRTYPVQNKLKEGYNYRISTVDGVIVDVEEIPIGTELQYKPVVQGTPGERTVLNFIKTALMPVGTTLYVYGGGWDWQDEGSSIQARTIGVSPDWVRFFNSQDENYTFRDRDDDIEKRDPKTSYYPFGAYNEYYYAGLDCSGFVGWTLYNTFENKSGEEGYVGSSTKIAKGLYNRGWGDFSQEVAPSDTNSYKLRPGDVVSIKGHVWISLGTCDDGSVLIVHSTNGFVSRTGQPGGGVAIGAIGTSKDCEAYRLADAYMSRYYPEWYRRYEVSLSKPETYYKIEGDTAGRFTWARDAVNGLTDELGVQNMKPADVLKLCFGE